MSDQDDAIGGLAHRMKCLYGRLNSTMPKPVTGFPPVVCVSPKGVGIYQDFRGGMSDTDIRQVLEELIYNIAHVKDPLKKHLREKGRSDKVVEQFIDQTEPLQIIIDLANTAKHGHPLRRWRSHHEPRLGEVGRVLQLSTGPEPRSAAIFTYDPHTGAPRITSAGTGAGNVVFMGDVLDKAGRKIGELMDIGTKAVRAWERFVSDQGLPEFRGQLTN